MTLPENSLGWRATPATCAPVPTAAQLMRDLEQLRDEMRTRHVAALPLFRRIPPHHRRSAQNLVDYLTLRDHDIRPLQAALAELGVSSLGRSEEHVMRSVEQVIDVLRVLDGRSGGRRTESAVAFGEGRQALVQNASELLGQAPEARSTRIMVTMSAETLGTGFASRLVEAGMDAARINCAHDDPETWRTMIDSVREASKKAGRSCRILMDLPGPKLRTGPIAGGPQVVCLRPRRDARGIPVSPARARLVATMSTEQRRSGQACPSVPVDPSWLVELRPGDHLRLRDTRGSARVLEVEDVDRGSATVVVWDTTYLETGLEIDVAGRAATRVGPLPHVDQAIRVYAGDIITLTGDLTPATPRPTRGVGDGPARHRIGCTLPGALRAARPGHGVWFDDGKFGGRVRAARDGEVDVEVTLAPPTGVNLRAGRGINLPDSTLRLPALRHEDDATFQFVADHADLLGLSFAQRASDVAALERRLEQLGRTDLGIVLKIETATGFQHLPDLLLAGMTADRLGVMVARGDLAVELGFERLAEVQDEILWLCDAGHVPVVWATQVLDQMARTGQPSRAEVSDAVMGARAECVMLNKGPYIVEAVVALDEILRHAETNQQKKVPLLRRLKSWSPERL